MKRKTAVLFLTVIFFCANQFIAQTKKSAPDNNKTALEGIIVEKYYTSTKADAADSAGGFLAEGSVTYRIYVDMKPGYHLQAVYGLAGHELFFKTTTKFFNNKLGGVSGDQISDSRLNENTVALDSWVTIGVATKTKLGILKAEDKDSSVIKRNTLDKADGLISGLTQKLLYYGFDLSFFNDQKNASYFSSDNGSFATIGGGKGPTPDNKVLIAQLTTTGKLSFELNLQVGTPSGSVIQYVAKNPKADEIKFKQLTYK